MYKGHTRHELPNFAANAQVTNRLLVAHSPEYSVPLMAAVTFIGVPGWAPISNISAVAHIAMIRKELGVDWVPALKETSLVCHSTPIQEGLRT